MTLLPILLPLSYDVESAGKKQNRSSWAMSLTGRIRDVLT
jgi:hypothetical protein